MKHKRPIDILLKCDSNQSCLTPNQTIVLNNSIKDYLGTCCSVIFPHYISTASNKACVINICWKTNVVYIFLRKKKQLEIIEVKIRKNITEHFKFSLVWNYLYENFSHLKYNNVGINYIYNNEFCFFYN